jgi:hypothetical protein
MPVPLCSDPSKPLVRSMDLATNSSLRQCAVQSTKFSPCRLMVPTVQGRLRRVAHVALSRCALCAERHGSADCPTCTRSNAGAVRYPILRKVGQQDGVTLIRLGCFASRRGNAADWLLWLKTPKIDRFGFVCLSTGRSWLKVLVSGQAERRISVSMVLEATPILFACPRAACARTRFSADASYQTVRYFEKESRRRFRRELLTRDEAQASLPFLRSCRSYCASRRHR